MEVSLPNESVLLHMPISGIIAYAVRACRRVQPLVTAERSATAIAIEDALLICELCADHRLSLSEVARRSERASKHLLVIWEDKYFSDHRDAGEEIINAFKHAADQLSVGNIGMHIRSVAEAAAATVQLTLRLVSGEQRSQLMKACEHDINVIGDLSEGANFLEALGPLWFDGAPEWFDSPSCGENELVVELSAPDDVSDEDVIEAVRRLALHVDDLHRGLGGKGLMIQQIEILEDCGVPEGVSGG